MYDEKSASDNGAGAGSVGDTGSGAGKVSSGVGRVIEVTFRRKGRNQRKVSE